jgi:uncharacterized OsmC-like protein/esterase/lipase
MKLNFRNQNGVELSATLDLPSGEVRAYVLFAHCFTCSKDFIATRSISRELVQKGFGVLRFDFTGLGQSKGDFSGTNFSSSVGDLIEAYRFMSKEYAPPQILVGHSLGGAAVLAAAKQLDAVEGVVTIAAPSEANHLTHLFDETSLKNIDSQGSAKVKLGGRDFHIQKQFIDDIKSSNFLDDLRDVRKSFLILHSPFDEIVSIDHAGKIFESVKHPKSFVSLGSADHLISKEKDARYIGEIISSWASNLTPLTTDLKKNDLGPHEVLVTNRPGHNFTQDIVTDIHQLTADEPAELKGDDLGFNPYELLLAALGACTSMTIGMYARRKKLDLTHVKVRLGHSKIHEKDSEDAEDKGRYLDVITKSISLEGNLTEGERTRILEIAERCPVNRTLQNEIQIEIGQN